MGFSGDTVGSLAPGDGGREASEEHAPTSEVVAEPKTGAQQSVLGGQFLFRLIEEA